MTQRHTYGHTTSGVSIADETIARFTEQAERGYEPAQLKGSRRGPGRPPLGEAAKSVESVRLDPDLRDEVAQRAQTDGVTVSELIRRALRLYLKSA
ncbi:MAG: ribbon-helix-helix domain-containing protein [Acidimicrobiales bacterium]